MINWIGVLSLSDASLTRARVGIDPVFVSVRLIFMQPVIWVLKLDQVKGRYWDGISGRYGILEV